MAAPGASADTRLAPPTPFTIVVENLKEIRGRVCVALWTGPDGFAQEGGKPAFDGCKPMTELPHKVQVDKVSCAQGCAIALYHDANANHSFDRFLGIPKEAVGFSNNPSIGLSVPSFEACRFIITTPGQQVVIRAKHYL